MAFIRLLLGNVVLEVHWVGLQFGQCTVHWRKIKKKSIVSWKRKLYFGVQSESESKLLNNLIIL